MFNITCSNNKSAHYALIDYLRGLALLLMFAYHFSFDLNYYQFIQTNFYNNPWWIHFRNFIVSLFLWLVGVSLWLATQKGINKKAFWQRIILVSIAAGLVTLSSVITFPNSYIFFGILHFIVIASIVGLLFIRFHYTNLLLGIVLIIIGSQLSHPVFNSPFLQWVGLMPQKPITEDYAPFLPWFGVVLIGQFSASVIFKYKTFKSLSGYFLHWGNKPSNYQKVICCMGRHSLIIYLLHQPLFLGILWIIKLMLGSTI